MKILDIFSWLPANELSIIDIENIVSKLYYDNSSYEEYLLQKVIPENADENIINTKNELIDEGKKVCFLIKDNKVVSVVGYKDEN